MSLTTINLAKETGQSYQPLFLFDFILNDGTSLSVCTHAVTYSGTTYHPRVLTQTIDTIQALSPQGIDIPPSISLTLADSDKQMWAIDDSVGFVGARVEVTFGFYDVDAGTWSETIVPFIGRCDLPAIADDSLTVTAGFILNPQAKNLPSFPIQPRCPKPFPATAAQKLLAAIPGNLYYACGVTDPSKTSCTYDPAGCAANGNSLRFGGITYQIPPGSHSRAYTTGNWLDLMSDPCSAKYGDYAPAGYGTAWVDCLVLDTFPEANSTRGHAVICDGLIANILKITVNDEVLPGATDLSGATQYPPADALFRYNVINQGDRTGRYDTDSPYNGGGDPFGSLCVFEWCVYHDLASGTPRVRALVTFPNVPHYAAIDHIAGGVVTWPAGFTNTDCGDGTAITISGNSNPALNGSFTLSVSGYGVVSIGGSSASGTGGWLSYAGASDNYAWAILNVLQRLGLAEADTDLESFASCAARFSTLVSYTTTLNKMYASGVVYNAGDVVKYLGSYYFSLQNNNYGHTPPISSSWWRLTTNPPSPSPTASQHAQYTCSVVIRQRLSVAEVLTGMLRGCNAHLGRNLSTGKIALFARDTIAVQQPTLPDGSNYATAVNGGYAAYHFTESSMLRENGKSTFSRPRRPGASIPNSVTIPFSNEENDYSGDSCKVVDTDNIDTMGQEINGNFPVLGANALDRANRVGSIYLAEQIGGAIYKWQTTAKAVKLLVGQIVLVSNAKHNFVWQPMRVLQIAPTQNWETCEITAALHDDGWYAPDFAMAAGSATNARRTSLARKPFAWAPYATNPVTGDALFSTTEWTFGLALSYPTLENGSPQPSAAITGAKPQNRPANLMPPAVSPQGTTVGTGGSIPGNGAVYFAAVASKDATGKPGPLSGLCQIAVTQAGSSNTITVPVNFLDPSGTGYQVYAGRYSSRLTAQDDTAHGIGTPRTVTLTSLAEDTWGAPDTQASRVVIKVKTVEHCGPWAAQVRTVGAGTLQFDAVWPVGQWNDYDCTLLSKADGSALPVLNFHVSTSTVNTLHVTPDPAALGVAPEDLIGMLSKPTVTGLVVSDPNWRNSLSNGGLGLGPHAEQGRVWRIVAGTGRGYRYPIADNDATSITVAGPWVITPDSTSRGIIEDAGYLTARGDSGQLANADPAAQITLSVQIANYAGQVLLFEGVTVDGAGNESPANLNPVRMLWVPGSQGTREITADASMRITDGLVEADATARPIGYTCLPFALVPNRTFTVVKTDGTGHTVTIQVDSPDDSFDDGTGSEVLSNQGDSFTFRIHG